MTAPQTSIPPAANALATIGTVFWCIQLVPQTWHNWRRKKTEGLPGSMMFLWALCSIPFGVYAIVQQFAVAIQIQPQVFGVLALVNWGQTLYYQDGWSQKRVIWLVICTCVLFGGLEVMLVLTLKIPYGYGVSWPILLTGIVAAVLLAAGLLPPYWEIWKRRGRVVGINFLFLTIDWLGAFFSLLALVEQKTWDALGGSLYIIVMVLEAGIFISHGIWLLRQRFRKGKDEADVEEGADTASGSGNESGNCSGDEAPAGPDIAIHHKSHDHAHANAMKDDKVGMAKDASGDVLAPSAAATKQNKTENKVATTKAWKPRAHSGLEEEWRE